MLNVSTLRPGFLVSCKTSLSGNVKYRSEDIEREHATDDGKLLAKWETERTIADPEEYERAVKARSKARGVVTGVCAASAFGLLCPEANAKELETAIAELRAIVEEFNASAKLTRIGVYVITGRIAADDVEAMRAINSEVRDLLERMENGVRNLDTKAIRDAAIKAKSIGSMLTPESATRVQMAVNAARKAATEIVKAGEQAAVEVDRRVIRTISEARTAFLDLDDKHAEVAIPAAKARALDLDVAKASADYVADAKRQARRVELD